MPNTMNNLKRIANTNQEVEEPKYACTPQSQHRFYNARLVLPDNNILFSLGLYQKQQSNCQFNTNACHNQRGRD